MRPTYLFYWFNTWQVSNGTPAFALFRGRWGGSALRASGRAIRHCSARAVAADPRFGEGAWLYTFRPVAARSETERGREIVFERCTPHSAGSRGGETARRAGGHRQGGYAATRICRGAFLARPGS